MLLKLNGSNFRTRADLYNGFNHVLSHKSLRYCRDFFLNAMEKIKIVFFICYFHSIFCYSQHNLVPDPGFDVTRAKKSDALFYFPDMMSRDWFTLTERGQPRDTTSVVYDRNTMILNPFYHNYPNTYYLSNALIRKITPRSYPSCAILIDPYGYYKFDHISPNHPYIMTMLKAPLKRDRYYYVEYYIKATCNYVYVSNIDLLFTVHEPGPYHCEDELHWPHAWECKDSLRYYPAIPQIQNPAGRFITDSINWTRICGVYKAEGNEQYITIGNFSHDRDTDTISGDKRKSWGGDYYLLDDVTVTELDLPTDTILCNNQFPFTLNPSSSYAAYFNYTQAPGNNFTIDAPGTYEYTIANEACSAKATIKINADQPLVFDIKDTTLCERDAPVLFTSPMQNLQNTWNNGSQAKTMQTSAAGKYWLELENVCGTQTDTFYVRLNYPPQVLSPDTTVILCKDDTLAQDATVYTSVNDYDHLLWSSGENSSNIHITKPGTHKLTAYNDCGEDIMMVTAHGCPPDPRYELFVPNLITPNGDNMNDVWEIRHKNISISRIEIMNIWGSPVYRSDNSSLSWRPAEEGIYFYLIEYTKPVTEEKAIEKGWMQVVK